jgi:hypothetical protein
MFCVLRAVHKFDFRLSINGGGGGLRNGVTDTLVSDMTCFFSLQQSSQVLGDSTQVVKVKRILLSKGHYSWDTKKTSLLRLHKSGLNVVQQRCKTRLSTEYPILVYTCDTLHKHTQSMILRAPCTLS